MSDVIKAQTGSVRKDMDVVSNEKRGSAHRVINPSVATQKAFCGYADIVGDEDH